MLPPHLFFFPLKNLLCSVRAILEARCYEYWPSVLVMCEAPARGQRDGHKAGLFCPLQRCPLGHLLISGGFALIHYQLCLRRDY